MADAAGIQAASADLLRASKASAWPAQAIHGCDGTATNHQPAMLICFIVLGIIANSTVCMQFQHSLWDDLDLAELEQGGMRTHVGGPEASPRSQTQQVKSMPPGLTLLFTFRDVIHEIHKPLAPICDVNSCLALYLNT